MTLTDEEAGEIIKDLLADAQCTWCDGTGRMPNLDGDGYTSDVCLNCGGACVEFESTRKIITLLESRIGQPDDLTAAYQFGFERGRDAGRKERG